MKRLIIMMFIVLLVFFTVAVDVRADDIGRFETEIKQILNRVSPSIVKVVAQNHKRYVATGIAIDPRHVISSVMVIRHPYDVIYVETVDGRELPVVIAGKDKESSLLLLKIKGDGPGDALTPIKTARTFETGDWAALVGAFYKKFPSIYQGILSSSSDDEILVNAPVAPGSSGGAVVNKKGELLGVIRGRFGFAYAPDYTFKDHAAEVLIKGVRSKEKELCYAVPVNRVLDITRDLRKYGTVKRGWLGVTIDSDARNRRVRIQQVIDGSPAHAAGLRKGDAVLEIDGQKIKIPRDITRIIRTRKPAQKVKIDIDRGGVRQPVLVALGELKRKPKKKKTDYLAALDRGIRALEVSELAHGLPRVENYVMSIGASRTLGVTLMSLTPELAREFKVEQGKGLMISKVREGTAAHKAGFRPADIIVAAGGKPVTDNASLRGALIRLKDDEALTVDIYRKGKPGKIRVVPDKKAKTNVVLDHLRDKLRDVRIKIDDDRLREIERKVLRRKLQKVDEQKVKAMVEAHREKIENARRRELETYRTEMERMRVEYDKMKRELERMKKKLKEENEKSD